MKSSVSGIDIARKIRQRDWESIIIMVTSHTELSYEVLKAQIMLLAFISKYDNCDEELDKVIKKAIKQLNNKKVIRYSSEGTTYIIRLEEIIYIEKDTIERKCIVRTIYGDIIVNKNLNKIKEDLDCRFYESHRGCIVNTDEILNIDWSNRIIYFKNGYSTDLLARDRKKEFKNYVGM